MSGSPATGKHRVCSRLHASLRGPGAPGTPRNGSGEVREAGCQQPQMPPWKPGWSHRQGCRGCCLSQGLLQLACPPRKPPHLASAPGSRAPVLGAQGSNLASQCSPAPRLLPELQGLAPSPSPALSHLDDLSSFTGPPRPHS